jgi:hypothetical protein
MFAQSHSFFDRTVESAKGSGPVTAVIALINIVSIKDACTIVLTLATLAHLLWVWRKDASKKKDKK